jgi:hypothetical protein
VTVDQLVGEDAALEVNVSLPIDIARRVPLIALGIFVKTAKVGSNDPVVALKGGVE